MYLNPCSKLRRSAIHLRFYSISNFRKDSTHYEILGLPHKATQKQIKEAYYALSKLYHPDRFKPNESTSKEGLFQRLSEAYSILGNPSSRKSYDIRLGVVKKFNPTAKNFRNRNTSSSENEHLVSYSEVKYDLKAHYSAHYGSVFQANQFRNYQERAELERRQKNRMSTFSVILSTLSSLFFVKYFIDSYKMSHPD